MKALIKPEFLALLEENNAYEKFAKNFEEFTLSCNKDIETEISRLNESESFEDFILDAFMWDEDEIDFWYNVSVSENTECKCYCSEGTD